MGYYLWFDKFLSKFHLTFSCHIILCHITAISHHITHNMTILSCTCLFIQLLFLKLFINFGEAFGLFPAEVLRKKTPTNPRSMGNPSIPPVECDFHPLRRPDSTSPPSFHCLTLQRLVSSFGDAAGDARKIAGGGISRLVKLHMARFSKKIEYLIHLLGSGSKAGCQKLI